MAVRIAAGRITIAAILAVGLGVVSLFQNDGMFFPAAITTLPQCSDGIDNDGDAKIDYVSPITINRPVQVNVGSQVLPNALNSGQVVTSGYFTGSFSYNPAGDSVACANVMSYSISGLDITVSNSDFPLDDNTGGCVLVLQVISGPYDPDCSSEFDDSEASTSGTTGGNGGNGTTGGGSSASSRSSVKISSSSKSSVTSSAVSSTASSGKSSSTVSSAASSGKSSSTVSSAASSGKSSSTSVRSTSSATSAATSPAVSSSVSSTLSSAFSYSSSTVSVSHSTSNRASSYSSAISSRTSNSSLSDSSSIQSSSSSSAPTQCGDGIVDADGPDDIVGNKDDEECDDGPDNTVAGPLDSTWCSMTCKLPECSNGKDQADIADGGTENVADALVDAADGGCYEKICNFNSSYLPGKDSESNPCLVKKLGTTPPVSPGDQKPIGSSCTDSTQCSGYYGTSSDTVFCISDAGPDYGICTDVGSNSSGLVSVRGEILLAQAGGGGANFPICIPGVCGFVVGDEAACGGAFQPDGDTCANAQVRQQCLYNSAVALGQCPGGDIVPVPFGSDYKCFEGQGADQQLMCGPAGQWFCKCPGDNPAQWAENLMQCGPKCGDGNVDPGEKCDDGNQVNNDQCTNTCQENVGGQCTGKECQDPAAIKACAAQNNAVCQADNKLPCVKCVPLIGGQCTGRECAEGGDAAAAAQGMECSLIPNFPCVTFIAPNSCGNGEIDSSRPQVVEQGCVVTGSSGQYCMPEGVLAGSGPGFQPADRCFQGADCRNTGAGCAWEITEGVKQCLMEVALDGEGLPPGCECQGTVMNPECPVQFTVNLCEQLNANGMQGSVDTSPLLRAQLVDDGRPERACSLDLRPCCRNGVFEYVERDPVTCEFPTCEADRRSCRNLGPTCIRAGCNGELCVSADEAIPPANSCDFSQDAACFDAATCEWTGTACDWRMTSELRECLADNANSPCPSDQSCVDRPSCIADGGTPGSVCGAGDTKVCCASDDTPDLEECDDGNRVDDDACGNDCRVNCSINADCPEGACVDGECVDQCAAPAQPMAMHESADTVERAVEFLPRLMARGDFSLLP